VSGQQRIWGQ
jgi:hypothetical protein